MTFSTSILIINVNFYGRVKDSAACMFPDRAGLTHYHIATQSSFPLLLRNLRASSLYVDKVNGIDSPPNVASEAG